MLSHYGITLCCICCYWWFYFFFLFHLYPCNLNIEYFLSFLPLYDCTTATVIRVVLFTKSNITIVVPSIVSVPVVFVVDGIIDDGAYTFCCMCLPPSCYYYYYGCFYNFVVDVLPLSPRLEVVASVVVVVVHL